jgi:hypothetical protein
MAKKKAAHGGARPGAGRKPSGPEGKAVVVAVSLPQGLVDGLDAYVEAHGGTKSAAVAAALRAWLKRKNR